MTTWRERIAEARARGSFTRDDINDARKWCSCAVAEQRALYPDVVIYKFNPAMFPTEIPADEELQQLGSGTYFFGAVAAQDFDGAEDALDRIEDRVLQLKREVPT